jgi:uncharacterized protein (TIRG00374 family)
MGPRSRLMLGVAVSVFFLYLVLRDLQLEEFVGYLREAQYVWLIPAVGVYFLAVVARTWRWQLMLRHIELVRIRKLFPIVCIGYMGNNIYPFRAGEILRSYVLKRETGIRMSESVGTVVVERIFDGLVMLLFVLVAVPFVPLEGEALGDYTYLITFAVLLFIGALAVGLTLAARPAFTRAVYSRMVHAVVPTSHHVSVLGLIDRFMVGLASLGKGREVLSIFGISVVIWLFETLKYWFVMHAFPFHVSFVTLMLVNGIVNLATTIPAAPGYVGTFDLPAIRILTRAGVDPDVAAAYTVVLHVALWLPITVLGGFFLWRSHMTLGQAQQAMSEEQVGEAGANAPA